MKTSPLSTRKMDLKMKWFVLIFFVGYFFLLWRYTVNIPYTDDYDNGILLAVLHLIQSLQAHDYQQFFSYLFEQHNEQRVVTARLLAYGQYLLFGAINFKWLIILGNLYKVAIFFLIYFLTSYRSSWYALLLLLLIFQLADWDASFWAMTAISIYTVIFFALLLAWYVSLQGKITHIITVLIVLLFIVNFIHGLRDAIARPFSLEHYKMNGHVMSGLAYAYSDMATYILQAAAERRFILCLSIINKGFI